MHPHQQPETLTSADQFELLCKDGSRRPVTEYLQCNWGLVPSHALVTSSARSAEERRRYQSFIAKAVQLYSSRPVANETVNERRYEGFNRFDKNTDDKYYDRSQTQQQQQNEQLQQQRRTNGGGRFIGGGDAADAGFGGERRDRYNQNAYGGADNETQLYEKFDLFESKRYGGRLNLMVQDAARNLIALPEDKQSFGGYLGDSLHRIMDIRSCPVGRMTLCVTSEAEFDKCVKMRVSFVVARDSIRMAN